MKPPSTEKWDWEREFRLEMAAILGREGKFAMNSMVALVRSLLTCQKEEARREVTKEIHEIVKRNADHENQMMKTQQIGEEIMDWLIAHKKFALSDAVREGKKV